MEIKIYCSWNWSPDIGDIWALILGLGDQQIYPWHANIFCSMGTSTDPGDPVRVRAK
jgi:hypothetical protein